MIRARVTPFVLPLVLLCAAAQAVSAQATAAKPPVAQPAARVAAAVPKDAAAIDKLFRSAVAPGEPGLAVIVVRKGQTLYRAAHGMANVELGVALKPDQVFRIGSVTKQ